MAKIKPTPAVAFIQGSAGASSYQSWRNGVNTMKARVTEIAGDPHSLKQQAIRNYMSSLIANWHEGSIDFKNLWEVAARAQIYKGNSTGGTRSIIKGNSGNGSGYHAFLTCNMLAISAGYDYNANGPINIPGTYSSHKPLCVRALAAEFVFDDPDWYISATWTCPDGSEAQDNMRLWIYDTSQSCHKQILLTHYVGDETASSEKYIYGPTGAKVYFQQYASNSLFRLQADVVYTLNGLVSAPSNTIDIEIP